jgi:hypothetical protein
MFRPNVYENEVKGEVSYEAIRVAFKAMQAFAPHGRDYQTYQNSAEVYRAARHQHNVWLTQLDDNAEDSGRGTVLLRLGPLAQSAAGMSCAI